MAATAEAGRLTEAHRLAQARLGAETVRQIRAAWALLDPDDLDGTVGRWLQVAVPIVQAQHNVSARLAANYVATFRSLELGVSATRFAPVLSQGAQRRAVTTSLIVTGPASVKAAMRRGVPIERALDVAEARSAAAAMRHALAGGRETLTHSIDADRQAIGIARFAGGRACAFCAMLASRGPIYKSRATAAGSRTTADGLHKVHDNCHCSFEPVYRSDAAWPAGSRRYRALWDEATAGEADQLNAFRRAIAAR